MKSTVVLLLNNYMQYDVIYVVSLHLVITCLSLLADSTFVRSGHISCHVYFKVGL